MPLPFAPLGGARRPGARLPFSAPLSPVSSQRLAAAGSTEFADMADAEAATQTNQMRADKMAFDMDQDLRNERRQRRNDRAKQEQDAANRLASIDVAKAEFGLATAPQTITDSERNRLEEDFTKTRSQIAAEAAAALAADTLASPEAQETEGGFLGFGAEPTAAALEKQKAAERFQDPTKITDDDLELYRAKNPASFAKFDELRTKLDTDQKARDSRSKAEFGVALAKARKSGFDPLAGMQPDEDPATAINRVQGEVETMQPRIAELQDKARSGLPLAELQPVLQELGALQTDFTRKTQFLETGRAAMEAQGRAAQVSEQATRENAVKPPIIPQVSAETAKTAALTLPDGSYETTQPENLAALAKDGSKVFWKQDGAASTATPESRAAKAAEAAQTIAEVKTAAQEMTAKTATERDRLQGLVNQGVMTPEHANAALEALIDSDDAQSDNAASVVNRKLEGAVRDFMDGQIDAKTLDSILHAAGSPSSAAEVAAEATQQRKVEDEHIAALKTKIEGDPNDPLLSGEALKLSKKVRDIENPGFLQKWGGWLKASPIGMTLGAIMDTIETVDWLADPSLWGKQEAEKAAILKTRLAEMRQQSKDTLAKELTKRGVDLADQPRLIARAQLEAERNSGIMEVAASRGGVAQAVGEKLPFVGAILEADRLLPFAETAYKLQAGEQVDADEMEAFSEFIRFAGNDQAFFTKVADTVASLPGYVVELASTSGVASAVRAGGTRVLKEALMAAATKEGKERLVKASAEAVAKKFGKDHAKKYAAWRIGSGLAQEAVRLPFASGGRVAAGFTRDAAMDGVQLSAGEEGIVAMMDREGRKGNWHRFADATVDSLIENVSERSGGYLANLIPAGVRQSIASMSQQAKGKLLSAALVKSLVAANPNKPVGQIGKFLKGANIGGTFEEMGEERIGSLLRDIYKGTTTGEWELTLPSAEDLAVELVAFSVPNAARGIQTNRHFAKLDKSLTSSDSEFTARLDSLYQSPEAEADRITEKIGTPVEADDLTNATALVGQFENADAVKAVDRLSLDLMERSEKAMAGGDLEKASRLRQRALQVNRSKGDLLDGEVLRAVGASKEIAGIRDTAMQARAQVEAMPDADPGKKQALAQVEKMEREADLAGALVKIAQGREGVLTAAEQEAIKPVKGTKPAVVQENGAFIITDDGIAGLRRIAPTASTYIKDGETVRRQKLLSQSTSAQQPPASSPAAGAPVVGGSSPQAGAAPTASSGAGVAQGAATAPPAVAAPVKFQSVPAGKGNVSIDPDGSIRVTWQNDDVDSTELIKEAAKKGFVAAISSSSNTSGVSKSVMVFKPGAGAAPAVSNADESALQASLEVILRENNASTQILQRRLGYGYQQASRMIDLLEQRGFIGPAVNGSPQRQILVNAQGKGSTAPTSTPAQAPAAQGQPATAAAPATGSQSSPTSAQPATTPAADKPKTAREWRNDTRKRLVDKIRDPKTKAKVSRVVDAVGDALEKRGNPPPGGIVTTDQKGGSGVSYNPATKAIEVNVRLLNSQVNDEKAGVLNDAKLADWMDRIASEEMTHFATVEAIPVDEAEAAWRKLGKTKAGKQLQADALRAYNAAYEQAGKQAPTLNAAASYYELIRMAIQNTEFRQRITEASFAEPGIKADLLAFLQRIADILTQRIAALPKAARAALEGDLAKVRSAMDALGIVTDSGKPAPAAVVVGTQQSSDTGTPAADPGQAAAGTSNIKGDSNLTLVKLRDGRLVRIRTKELNEGKGEIVRAFTPEGKPIRGDAGSIPRSEIVMGAGTTPVDAAANQAATSPTNDKPEPTDAQKKAGNYEMGHIKIGGMDITIENPAGSVRSGTDKDGERWEVTMKSHYGYIKGTTGKDGDHIDIFIEEGTPEDYSFGVYVVNQVNADGEFDEHKAIMGPNITSFMEARAAYLANYSPGWQGDGSIAWFPQASFKEWVTKRKRSAPAETPIMTRKEPKQTAQVQAPLEAKKLQELKEALAQLERWREPKEANPAYAKRISMYESGRWSLSDTDAPNVTLDNIQKDTRDARRSWAVSNIEALGKARTEMVNILAADKSLIDMLNSSSNQPSLVLDVLERKIQTILGDRLTATTNMREEGKITDHFSTLLDNPQWLESIMRQLRKLQADTETNATPPVNAPTAADENKPAVSEQPAVSEAEQKAADAMRENLKGLFSAARLMSAGQSADDPAVMALQTLSEVDELFRYPVLPNVSSLPEIMRQVFPGSRYLGDATRPDEKDESTADKRRMFTTPNGKEFYVYDRGDEVWIDVSRLEEGDSGSAIYAAVGNYAFNADKTFIGDPAGLSEAAIIRRTSHMISLALRYGTTRHIEPAKEQLAGMPEKGIAPLQMTGSYDQQVRGLIDSFLATSRNLYPETNNATYDFDTGVFKDASGRVDAAGTNLDGSGAGAGELPMPRRSEDGQGDIGGTRRSEATNRRIVFLKSLVSATSEEQSRLLENFRRWGRAYVKDGGLTNLFSAPRPAAEWRDEDIPEDRIPGIMQTTKLVIDAGVRTPEDFAAFMERTFPGGGSRPFVSGIWQIMGGMRKELRTATIPDWAGIYAGIDGTAEMSDDPGDETQSADSQGSPPELPQDAGGTERPTDGRGDDASGEDGTGSGSAAGGKRPRKRKSTPGVGDGDGSGSLGTDEIQSGEQGDTSPGGSGTVGADGVDSQQSGSGDGMVEPERRPARSNYYLSDPDSIVGGGPKARFNKNKRALEVLEAVQSEGRDPTDAELDILAAYTGWGALAQELFQGGTFDRHAGPEEWKEESMWLREHLGRDAWMSAFDSILNAHYTDPPSITAMWDMVRRLGFNGGRVLEPSEAIGTFWSLMPRDLMDRSQLTGIEMDPTTAAIARMLHPRVNHRTMPYQQSQTSDNFYDLAIGNWPFSATDKPADKRFDHLQASVHDYFFLKTLSQVRPGGLVIGITSSSTMDKKNSRIRKYLAARGELVSAFRLPTGAFGKYAGTKVVVDLIIIKKREQELTEDASGQGWIESVKDPQGRDFHINEYYVANPQNIIGDLDFGHGTTFNRAGMIVNRRPDYEQVLPQLFNRVPENVMTPWNPIGRERIIQNTTAERRQGAVVESGEGLYVVDGESLIPLQDKAKWEIKDAKKLAKRKLEARALIKMRTALTDLLDSYRRNESGDTQREALKAAYDGFRKEHGKLNDSFMLGRFRQAGDQDAINILALVDYNQSTKTETPRALMLRNTMRRNELDAKGSIADAYALHRSETLDFDPVKVAALAGPEVTSDQVIDFLKERNLVYKLPDGRWIPGELYLAGNVRQKLREAIAAKEEGVEGMEPGIESLRAIIPADVPYHQITVQMGAAWIAPTDYQDFIKETLGGRDEDVQVVKALSGYNVRISNQTADSADARNTWNVVDEVGRSRLHPSRIFQAAMNGTELTVKDTVRDENGTREVLNEVLTRRAMELRDRIRNQFELWLWRDEGRIARLQTNYNELKNSVVNPSHDGSHLRLPGLALTIGNKGDAFEFRQHQLNAVWRGILTRQGVYAHEVGTGKTFTMAGLAIEGRRLGAHRKPIIFAHNANAASVAADFRLAYPGAKVLFVDNLSPSTKELTLRQIATDDWDAIIVPHSLVDRFGLKPESVRALAQPQLDRIEAEFWEEIDDLGLDASQIDLDNTRALGALLNRAKGSSTAKDLANQRRRIMTRIDQQIAKFSGPGTVFFEDMGIDAVIVDEAHVFKKIALATRKTIKGLNKDESGKGFQLGLLTDWLKTQTGGKGVHLFTGTPVTNTLNEVFNMMRFAMDKEMSEAGVDSFDDFYNDYAAGYSDTEPTSGGTYEEVLRLRGFNNIPELARMASQAFDVVRADEMPEFTPRDSKEGLTENPIGRPHKQVRPVVIQPTAVATRLKTWIRQRFFYYRGLDARSRMFLKRAGGDQPVMMDADGKAGALDPRLVSMTAEDDPNSKLNFAVRNIMEHYNEHESATQMVFVERGAGDYTEAEVAVRDGDGMPIYNNDGVKLTQKERRAQFNLLRDMVEKLVAQGVKPEEIAVFQNMALLPLADGRDDVLLKVRRVKDATDKEEIAKEMREGKIRIAFGGTETMGTGVNAQTWMRAMHHLDVPYMPGELEQRNGRGWRQGNKWNTVFEYRYTVEGSHDAKMWSTLLNKVKFIERFIGMLQGKNLVRSLEGEGADAAEDADGISMADFEQMFSTAAGDPRLILRSSLSKKVDRLRQGRSVHLQFLEQTRRKVESLENREIPNMEASIATLDRGTELFTELAGKPFQITLRDQEYTERKDFDEAMKRLPRYTDRKQIGQYGPFAIWVRPGIGTEFYELTAVGGFKAEFASPSIASIEGTLRAMKKRSENVKAQIEESQQSIVRAKAEMQKPYGRQDELESAETALARLEREIVLSPWPAPAWFRVGAPQGSLIYLREKGELVAYDIEAHRWDENDYWAMVMRGGELVPVPYKELLDATGSRLFEDQEFTPPPAAPPVQADGNQGAFPGIERGLDSEFGSRILIDRQTGQRSSSPKFQTPYMIVETGFYDRPGDNTPQRATERLVGEIIEERQPTEGMLLDVPRRVRGMARRRAQLRRIIANLERRLDDPEVQAGRSFHSGNNQERLDELTKELELTEAIMMSTPQAPLNSAPRVVSPSQDAEYLAAVEAGDIPAETPVYGPDSRVELSRKFGIPSALYGPASRVMVFWDESKDKIGAVLVLPERTAPSKPVTEQEMNDRRYLALVESHEKGNPVLPELQRLVNEAAGSIKESPPSGHPYAPKGSGDYISTVSIVKWSKANGLDVVRFTSKDNDAMQNAVAIEEAARQNAENWIQERGGFVEYDPEANEGQSPYSPIAYDPSGAIMPPSQRFNPASNNILQSAPRLGIDDPDFIEALDFLNEQLPSETEREDLLNRAGFNWNRTYTQDELRQAASGVRFGLRSEYDERLDRQTHEGWNAEAVEMLRNNRQGVIRDLVATAAAGEAIINPVQVKASQLLLPSLTMRALAAGDRQAMRDAEALTWAYDIAGTETARGLAARWQPHKTPEELHRELIAKAIFTPSKADRDRAAKAPTPTGKRRRIAELEAEIERIKAEAIASERNILQQASDMLNQANRSANTMTAEMRKELNRIRRETTQELKTLREQLQNLQDQKDSLQILAEANDKRLKQIEEAFKEMGVTFQDLFVSKEAVVALRTSSMVKNVLSQFNEKERLVTKMRMEAKTDRHIAKKLNISKTAVEAINERFNVAFRAQAREWVKRGFSAADLDGSVDIATLIDEKGNLLSAARPTLTDAEVDAKVDEIFRVIVPSEEARATGALKRIPGGTKEGEFGFDLSKPEHAAMLMRAIQRLDSTGMDMVYEYWINGLLSGPATHIANIAGNTGNAAWEYAVQRPVEMLVNSIITRDAAGAQFDEVKSMAKYLGLAASTAIRYARIVWDTEVSLFDPQWLNKPVAIGTTSGDKGQVQRFAIKGTKGRVIRLPSRALAFADEFAKHLFGMLEAAAQAHRLAKAEGLKGAEFDARVDRLVKTPGSPAWIAAVDKAHAITFTSELPAPLQKMQDVLHERAKTPWGAALKTFLRFLFPFVRTPYNIFATGLRKTPLGSLRMIGKGIAAYRSNEPFFDSYPKAAMAADIAEQLLAWTATMMLIGVAEGDPDDDEKTLLITGSRSLADNRGEDQMLSRMKGGENTILWKGKPILHYGRYEPFATVITTVVDAARNMKAMGQGRSTKEAFDQTWRGFLNQARSKTFLQGLEGLMSMIEGHKNLTDSAVKALAQGVVPNLVRQPVRAMDDFARDSRNAPWYYQAFPAGGLAEPLYDLYGRPIQKSGSPLTRALVSVPTKQAPIVPADRAMSRFNLENPNDSYYPQQPNKSMFRYKVPVPGLDAKGRPKFEYKDMTPQEAAAFRKRAGQQFAAEATMTFPFGAGTATPLQMEDIKAKRDRAQREAKEAMFPGRAPAMPPRKAPTLAELFGRRLRQ